MFNNQTVGYIALNLCVYPKLPFIGISGVTYKLGQLSNAFASYTYLGIGMLWFSDSTSDPIDDLHKIGVIFLLLRGLLWLTSRLNGLKGGYAGLKRVGDIAHLTNNLNLQLNMALLIRFNQLIRLS